MTHTSTLPNWFPSDIQYIFALEASYRTGLQLYILDIGLKQNICCLHKECAATCLTASKTLINVSPLAVFYCRSPLWKTVSPEDRKLCLSVADDGEFW